MNIPVAVQLLPGTLQKALQRPQAIDPVWLHPPHQKAQPQHHPALRRFPAQLQRTSVQASPTLTRSIMYSSECMLMIHWG